MTQGWIKLHRKICEWEWYKDQNTLRVFIHCLIRANHKSQKWRGINLNAGEFVTSLSNLATDTCLTNQQARTALSKLKITNNITIKSTNKYSIITVLNWRNYQMESEETASEQQSNNKQITNKQQSNNKQITTDKNVKNVKNDKNDKNGVRKDKSSEPDFERRVKSVFDYWVLVMGKNPSSAKLTPKRKRAISDRLKDYTKDQIFEAIRNCRDDEWSMGANERCKPFNDIELICRSGEKLESFLTERVEPKMKIVSDITRQNIINLKDWGE